MTSAGAAGAAAAGTAALANAVAVFRVPPPDPSYWCCAAGSYTGRGGGHYNSPLDRKVDPLPLPLLAAPSQRDAMLEGHMEMCGPEPHTSRVATQVERAQRPHVDALRHWAEEAAGERAPGPRAPALAVPPPSAFVFAVPANWAPHETAKDPLKSHMCVRRAREQELIPCVALLEGLCRPQHQCGLAGDRGSGPKGF